jgi:O-antigen ligase
MVSIIPLLFSVLVFFYVVYLIRPHWILYFYVFSLPLLYGANEIVLGLNAGEIATLCIITLGFPALLITKRDLSKISNFKFIILPYLGLTVISLVSSIINNIKSQSEIMSSIFKPLSFALVGILIIIYCDTQTKLKNLIKAIIFGAFAVSLYSIFSYITGIGVLYHPIFGYSRISGTFEHWNQLGGYLALVSPITFGYALTEKNLLVRYYFFIIFLMQICALLLSLTIASVIALIGAVLIYITFLKRFRFGILLKFIIALSIAFFAVAAMNQTIESRFKSETIINRIIDRLITYSAGINLIRDNFWWGVGSSELVYKNIIERYYLTSLGETSSIPHNSFITIWAEKGVFGFACSDWFYFFSFAYRVRGNIQILITVID